MSSNIYESLIKWFKDTILEFRFQFQQADQQVKNAIWNTEDFNPPCQVLALSLASPRITFVFVTKDKKRNDLDIRAFGSVLPHELTSTMEQILEDKTLYRPLKDDERYGSDEESFGKYLEDMFLGVFEIVKSQALGKSIDPNKVSVGWKMSMMLSGFNWLVYNDLTSVNPPNFVGEIFSEARKRISEEKNAGKVEAIDESQKEELVHGFITYFYPHVWIGEIPEFDFRRRVEGLAVLPKYYSTTYKERLVLVSQKGLLFIGEKERESCMKMMNEIFGTSLILGYDFDVVRPNDCGIAEASEKQVALRSWQWPMSMSRNWQAGLEYGAVNEQTLKEAIKMPSERVREIISIAEKATKSPDNSNAIVFLGLAKAHHRNGEYTESFIMSWIIIERHLRGSILHFLENKGATRKRKDKISNWNIDVVIELLFNLGQIPQDSYRLLMDLKNIRNEINHEGSVSSLNDATSCYEFAKAIVKENFDDT